MGQTFVRLPDDSANTGKKEDHSGPLVSGNVRENVVIASPTVDANVIEPATADPASNVLALPVRDPHAPAVDTATTATAAATGTTADVAVTGDNTGTLSAKLRGLSKMLADVWDSGNHWLKVSIQNATLAVTQSGGWTVTANADTVKTLKTITGSASATFTAVAAVAAKRLKVYSLSLTLMSPTAVTITFKDGSGGTAIGTYLLQTPSGVMGGIADHVSVPAILFATTAGNLLEMAFSAGVTVTYNIRYWDDDAT